jgi:hypothetical protein
MEYTINFVGVASAIFVSFAVALGLEWLSLVMMMRLMPAGNAPQTANRGVATEASQPSKREAGKAA